nr:hypothetical protein JVH1_6789 [Rhodococcus sp. JVH1]
MVGAAGDDSAGAVGYSIRQNYEYRAVFAGKVVPTVRAALSRN